MPFPAFLLDWAARKRYLCGNNLPPGWCLTPVTDQPIAPDVFGRLQTATGADPGELAGLCRDYLAEARRSLAHLRSALANRDAGRFRDRAHYLRGSSLVMGATVVAHCCTLLEQMGLNSDLHDAAPLLEQTSQALDAAQAELAQRLGASVVPVDDSAA